MIAPDWSFMKDFVTPKPDPDERVLTKAWVECGLSLPSSEFFLSVLTTYGLQPHNICPNSYLLLSNFVTLCEGHLGIRPHIHMWQLFFRVKKETKDKVMVNYGSMTFMLCPGRMYPPHSSHESVRYWNAGWFYAKNIQVPDVHEGLPKFINKPPKELASWSFVPALAQYPELDKAARRISRSVHDGLTKTDLTLSWFSRRIQPLKYNKRLICEYTGVDDQLRVTRDNLPTDSLNRRIKMLVKIPRGQPVPEIVKDIKTNNQCPPLNSLAEEDFQTEKWDLEQDLLNSMLNNAWGKADAESSQIQNFKKEIGQFCDQLLVKRKEQQVLHYELHKNIALQHSVTLNQADKICVAKEKNADLERQLAESQGASSSLATASSELESPRSSYKDLKTKLMEADQKREYAEKQLAERNSELIKKEADFAIKRKPLGYDEERRNQFPRDDLIQLAGDDCKDLISTCRKICHNLAIRDNRTCDVHDLIQRRDILPELVVDLKASSSRGAAAMSLQMCLAHVSELNIDRVTSGVPSTSDVKALLNAVSGYDTRIAWRIRHEEFYDKVVLPIDEPLEAEIEKEREAEARPTRSGDGSQYTWTSSKEARKNKSKGSAASPTEEDEESDDDDVSSPPQDEDKSEPQADVEGCSSSTKEK
ncbi:hypothetical protein QYE76_033052 [Lolium multiflorum]|uniref:Transposase (putative) gypsy type domain-containing protein n=1 Tax=Lolium multiflorum TaxID=4521 RepID=A0AAD8VJY8_LOLMU|nr:hypothetical protein QYE76_033052 [Lolium multiflorum]